MLPVAVWLLAQAPVPEAPLPPPPAREVAAPPAEQPAETPAEQPAEQPPFSLAVIGAEQAVVVVTDRWDAVIGQLKRYEKVGPRWMQVGGPIEVVVGEGGLGWGLGLHPHAVAAGVGDPRKIEGDGRAPAGVFALVSAFGRGTPTMKTSMPWLETRPGLSCIDDPRSRRYNRLVDTSAETSPPDWRTAEAMLREDDGYDLGVLVDHNGLGDGRSAVVPGRGSCAFLHVWRRKGRGTAGCTAMSRDDLEKVVEWLDPRRKPVLVQLPKGELSKRKLPWALP